MVNTQLTQPASLPPINDQLAETKSSFSLTRCQLILVVGCLVLLFIFGLGLWTGEERGLRK